MLKLLSSYEPRIRRQGKAHGEAARSELTLTPGGSSYRRLKVCVTVENPFGLSRGVARVEAGEEAIEGRWVEVKDNGGLHTVRVVLGETGEWRQGSAQEGEVERQQ